MKKLVVLLLVSLMATSAFAQIDPDPNGIGVYFDMGANEVELNIGASIPFFAYVCVTNPSHDVSGIEFGYDVAVPAGMEGMIFRLANILPAGAIDLGTNTNMLLGDYIVGLAAPLPAAPVVPFVTWQFMLLAPTTMSFELGASSIPSIPSYDGPAMEIGGSLVSLGESSSEGREAGVNLTGTVGVEDTSFGSVKSLFR